MSSFNGTEVPDLSKRLHQATSEINQLKEVFKVPSISFGVVHQGKVIRKQSIGYRDVDNRLNADPDTIYPISSCTKMFTAAGIALLVDEGKLQWQGQVSKNLPEFNPQGNPAIALESDLIDLLRHSNGMPDATMLTVGPRGCHLHDCGIKGLIPLFNQLPTANADGQRFNRHWTYSNMNFILGGEIISRVSGQTYPDFIRSHILSPLGMTRTVLTKADIPDDNVACQYTLLRDGTLKQLPPNHWPFDKSRPDIPGSGMGSSLNDMLTWCMAVLSAENEESELDSSMPERRKSPLKQMTRLRRGYWTRPPEDPDKSNGAAFGMGWIRMTLPTSMVGTYSGNRYTRDPKGPWKLHLDRNNILGLDSPPREMIGHTGGAIGGIATVWTFPETQSAVCVLVNGRSLGDASDFAAQALIQALFDLKPQVDLLSWARKEAELSANSLTNDLLTLWKANRREADRERDPERYVGEYKGFNDLFTLSVGTSPASTPDQECDSRLTLTFNNVDRTTCELVFYKQDTYSVFTGDLDLWMAEWFHYRDYRQTLLEFELDDAGLVLGLWWMWDTDEERAWFRRGDGGRAVLN
ncbi:serine hydrolase domain-containing protein [Aspergillus mulundensis]|uniref:Beta-lactamase-related domain-containing protein n=1 Tax=Aspergillus mulundensis TaxID=1810919 RepID=A0A3D8SJF9_9EURO|nr:hypothetical protein DSM5745_03117 [Aspergillus mulundensis]RDW86475.1 hypothetical protein DSM5745_03117 [Aspergillus mulundensis]